MPLMTHFIIMHNKFKTLVLLPILLPGLLSSLLISSHAIAGGPLVLEGPTGNTPVNYLNPTITLHIENGTLGLLSNAAADTLVQQAFALWSNVNTSSINLVIDETQINLDVNIDNFDTYLPTIDEKTYNDDDNLNPVVYDNNGEIIDAFFGAGQSDFTIGFAASILNIGASHFNEGYSVINGKDLGLSDSNLKLLIAHEIAHFTGLDHTQVNINNQESDFRFPFICSTSNREDYPVMYPFICRNIETLHSDDISALSALYPSADINNHFGIIEGHFVDESGTAILGANIWAENITTGETVSIVSDYLMQGTGFYKLYLPAGNYTLHANSINILFNGGSGIGPYASSIFDVSFQSPHPITPVTYQGLTPGNIEVITIAAHQTTSINFSATGTATETVTVTETVNSKIDTSGGSGSIHLISLFLLGVLLITARRAKNYSALQL